MPLPSLCIQNKSKCKQKVSHRHNGFTWHALWVSLISRILWAHQNSALLGPLQNTRGAEAGEEQWTLTLHSSLLTCVLRQCLVGLHLLNLSSKIEWSRISGQWQHNIKPSARLSARGIPWDCGEHTPTNPTPRWWPNAEPRQSEFRAPALNHHALPPSDCAQRHLYKVLLYVSIIHRIKIKIIVAVGPWESSLLILQTQIRGLKSQDDSPGQSNCRNECNGPSFPSPALPWPTSLLLTHSSSLMPWQPCLWSPFGSGKTNSHPFYQGPEKSSQAGLAKPHTPKNLATAVGMRDTLLPPQYMPRILRRADHGILEHPVANLSLCRQWPCETKDAVEEDRAERCREK